MSGKERLQVAFDEPQEANINAKQLLFNFDSSKTNRFTTSQETSRTGPTTSTKKKRSGVFESSPSN
jgi:hypothetical protein